MKPKSSKPRNFNWCVSLRSIDGPGIVTIDYVFPDQDQRYRRSTLDVAEMQKERGWWSGGEAYWIDQARSLLYGLTRAKWGGRRPDPVHYSNDDVAMLARDLRRMSRMAALEVDGHEMPNKVWPTYKHPQALAGLPA